MTIRLLTENKRQRVWEVTRSAGRTNGLEEGLPGRRGWTIPERHPLAGVKSATRAQLVHNFGAGPRRLSIAAPPENSTLPLETRPVN